ncbi:MAG: hypothetical protein GQ537_10605 [Gammaproteobacteria bacterium]|nr:hypothetical protein [Gammaproteobacteria bacterium]
MIEFIGITVLVCLVFMGLYRLICGGAPPCKYFTARRYESYDWFDKELEKETDEQTALHGACGGKVPPFDQEK